MGKLMFGKLNMTIYDQCEDKFKYNQFSSDEYDELLQTKQRVTATKTKNLILEDKNLLLVKPSSGNLHKFVAEEDSCFFDICLPNYTNESSSKRKITYYNELMDDIDPISANK